MSREQGFYRVVYDGHPGVAHCRPEDDVVEFWSVMYTRDIAQFKDMATQTYVSSRGKDFSKLTVLGKIDLA